MKRYLVILSIVFLTGIIIGFASNVAWALDLKLYTRSDINTSAVRDDSLAVRLSEDNDNKIQALLEVNLDLGHTFFEMFRLYTDSSLLYGSNTNLALLKINEVRAELTPHEYLSVWFGKRRVDYSVGYAFTPTNVLSPAKSPSEPFLEREGRYGAGLTVPLDHVTFSFTWAVDHEDSKYGVPSALDFTSNSFLGGIYLNLWQSDINMIYANVKQQHRGGLNISRYLFSELELHLDALMQQGRSVPQLISPNQGTSMLAAPSFEDEGVYFKGLVGLRYEFLQTMGLANLEYYYNGAGLSDSEIEQIYGFLDKSATLQSSTGATGLAGQDPSMGLDVLFGAGLPGRHHIMLFLQYRELLDYWTPSLSCIWSLQDSSVQFYPKMGYKLQDVVMIETGLIIPVGGASSEFGMLPKALTHMIRIWVYI